MRKPVARAIVVLLAGAICFPGLAHADNPMGYRLLDQADGASLPHRGGALGMDIERAQHVDDDGLAFDIIRVKQVRRGSPGAQAGFTAGDQIIAVDGQVFATLATFAAYIGSLNPGTQIKVDTIPVGGGPQQAQRLVATVGEGGRAVAPATSTGLTTGEKVAIGVGAVALFGCYELGCFTHPHRAAQVPNGRNSTMPTPRPDAH